MATSAVLFAWMNVFARLATHSASWATVATVRALIGAVVAFAVARLRGSSLALHDKRAVLGRSIFGTATMVATFYALSSRTLALGDTVTLLNLTPVYLALFAPFVLRERTTSSVAFAIALSLVGVLFVLRPSVLFGAATVSVVPTTYAGYAGPSASVTAIVAIVAALLSSLAMMMLRKAGQTESTEAVVFWFSLFATVVLGAIAAFDGRWPEAGDVGFMIGAGLCAGFAQIAMTRAYALESAARVSGVGYLAVVASALLGVLVFHERPPAIAYFGMMLVIAGGLAITFARAAHLPER